MENISFAPCPTCGALAQHVAGDPETWRHYNPMTATQQDSVAVLREMEAVSCDGGLTMARLNDWLIRLRRALQSQQVASADRGEAERAPDGYHYVYPYEITQALTQHYKNTSGDDRHVPATITAVETMNSLLRIIEVIRRDATAGGREADHG